MNTTTPEIFGITPAAEALVLSPLSLQADASGSIEPAVLGWLRDHGPSSRERIRAAASGDLFEEIDDAIRQMESPALFVTLNAAGNYEITDAGREWLDAPHAPA